MAKPRSHKGQHWIPKSYLSAWTDPECPPRHEPFVHIFSKDGTVHYRRAPHNIFTETDIYTIKRPDGGRDLRMEHGLSGLEKDFVRIRDDFLAPQKPLPPILYAKLIVFVAAMHARTPAMRDHHASQWSDVLKSMDELAERMKDATPEQKRAASMSLSSKKDRKGMSHEQVRKIVASPMQHLLRPLIQAVVLPLGRMMHCTVLNAGAFQDFITSDAPVVWFDPEAYKRPPIFRTPAFMYETLEITFPVSPRQMLLFTRGSPGLDYRDWPNILVRDANRRTRGLCDQQFVVCRDFIDPFWLDPGKMPDDAWDKVHGNDVDSELEGDD